MAFGRRLATRSTTGSKSALRTAELVVLPGGFAVHPHHAGPAVLVLLVATAGLGLVQLGAVGALRRRPLATLGAGVLGATLVLPPQLAWAGPPPGGGSTWRRFTVTDPLGTALLVTAAGGAVVARRIFEPFGLVVAESSTEGTHRVFAGHQFEPEVGLYDAKARWYDPALGRFLSVDPVVRSHAAPQSKNGYSYVENNPVNAVDPTGMFLEGGGGGGLAAVASALNFAFASFERQVGTASFLMHLAQAGTAYSWLGAMANQLRQSLRQVEEAQAWGIIFLLGLERAFANLRRAWAELGSRSRRQRETVVASPTVQSSTSSADPPSGVREVLEPANPPFGVFKGRTTVPVEVDAQRLRIELENVSGVPLLAVTSIVVRTSTGVDLGQGGFNVPVGKTMVFDSESILAETPLNLRVTIDVQNEAAVAVRFFGVRLERTPTPTIRSRP